MKQINKFLKTNANKNILIFIGLTLFSLGLTDVILSSFLSINLTNSFLLPFFLAFIGLYLMRFELTNFNLVNKLNKNLNIDFFNSILTILSIFFY